MTNLELRNLFVATYKVECQKAKPTIVPIDFPDKLIASWISQAENDILGRLKIIKNYQDLRFSLGINTISVPVTFGSAISCEYNGVPLKKVDIADIRTTGSYTTGDPQVYAIWIDPNGYNLTIAPEITKELMIRLWFNVNVGQYSPSLNKNQNFATFDGSTFEGNIILPDHYIQPIIYYMLEQGMGGFLQKYELELAKLRQLDTSTGNCKIEYQMN